MNPSSGIKWVGTLLVALLAVQASARTYSVDGMVGQVNGRAIYTSDVLEPIKDQLATLGRELPPDTFRNRAASLIAGRLSAMVTDALIYGEAQRDLSDAERQGLLRATQAQRESILREYGQGSPALAEANLLEKTGLNLDQTLEEWRQTAIIRRYIGQKIRPKVNVTRKDVKRYYEDHYDRFNPPSSRTVRVIQVDSQEDAQAIQTMLEAATPFAQAAADPRNVFRPGTGGLMGEMAGEQLFADEQVNRAVLDLQAGTCAGPITVGEKRWFVCVEKINQPQGQPLMQVQVQISGILFEQQFREYSERYRRQLFEEGSYNSIEQMTMSLLKIANDRYTQTDK
jgi:PPIC-type PPIASE domain